MAENKIFNEKTPSEKNEVNPDQFADIKVDTLVGEDKKYKTADDLAKAYAHSDAFIAQTKAERAEDRAKIKVLEDMLNAQQNKTSMEDPGLNSPNEKNPPVDNGEPNLAESEENNSDLDIESRFKELYEKQKEQDSYSTNVETAANKLTEKFGSEALANKFVREKAEDLKVSVDWLMDMAGRSPVALYKTLGIEGTASKSSPNASNLEAINGAAFRGESTSDKRNFKYYEEIRKSDLKAYYKADMQAQLMKDAREQGSAFYS